MLKNGIDSDIGFLLSSSMITPNHLVTVNINFSFYGDTFVFDDVSVTSPLNDTFLMNKLCPLKVRSVVKPMLEPKHPKKFPKALVFDSRANIYIFDNPNSLSDMKTSIALTINIVCNQVSCLCDVLKCLPLPSTRHYYQTSTNIPNLIGLPYSLIYIRLSWTQ